MIKPISTHGLTLTYSGYGKYTVTWPGYPSDKGRAVRRTVQVDSLSEYKQAASLAAEAFVAWIESTSMFTDKDLCYHVDSLSIAGTSNPNKYSLHLSGDWVLSAPLTL